MLSLILEILVNFFIVGMYGGLFLYLPSYVLIRALPVTRLEKITITLVASFSLYSLLIYLVRSLNAPFWIVEFLLIGLMLVYGYMNSRFRIRLDINAFIGMTKSKIIEIHKNLKNLTRQQGFFVFIAIFSALIQSAVLLKSGISSENGLQFVELSFHDSMQHISFINRLYESGHVSHPGFSGVELKNYHYLIDSTIAAITRFPFISLYHTYYRIYPLFISIVFSLSIFAFSRRLIKSEAAANLAVIFTLFAGNASYFAQFFRGEEFSWGSNTFLINPIIDILQNPASIFVLAQMLMVLLLMQIYEISEDLDQTKSLKSKSKLQATSYKLQAFLQKFIRSEKNSSLAEKMLILVLIGLITGTMISFKAWGGLVLNFGLIVAAFWRLVRYRDPKLFISVAVSIVITLILFLPGYDAESSASPIWQPGWSLRRMLNDADRWNDIPDMYQEETFIFQERWLHLIKLYSKWVFIYWLGNYWVRAIGFLAILALLRKHINLQAHEMAIGAITLSSFSLPLLFNQGRMAYDIEQFAPYALVLSSIFTILVLTNMCKWLDKKFGLPVLSALILSVPVLVSLPSNYTSLRDRIRGDLRYVSEAELEIFEYIQENTPTDAIFMISDSHRNVATLEFAALSVRDTYFSGRTLSVITGEPFEERKDKIDTFFKSMDGARMREFAQENGITYIFLYEEDIERFDVDRFPFEPLYENKAGVIFSI